MRLSLVVLFSVIYISAFSQNRNAIWVFGDSAGIDFSIPGNPIPITSGMDGRGSCASIADSLGNKQLYSFTVAITGDWSTKVYNHLDQLVQNGDSITGQAWYNELQIIPFSYDSDKYYIFSYGLDVPNNEGLYYSVIDLKLNNGLGAAIIKNVQINSNKIADCLTSVKHGNGRDWWVIAKYSSPIMPTFNRFFKYLVTPDSIVAFPSQDFNDASDVDIQKIAWHPEFNKFMLISATGYMAEFNFDRCSGMISLDRTIFTQPISNNTRLFCEGAYSSNGNLFYVSTNQWFGIDTMRLLQINLNLLNPANNIDTLEEWSGKISSAAVRRGPDGKVYCARWYLCNAAPYCFPYPDSARNFVNENLSVVNSPDSVGSACNYIPYSFYLGGKRTYIGLPNNPEYDLGPLAGSLCDSLTSNIKAINNDFSFSISPNPAQKNITLAFVQRLSKPMKVEIFDMNGRRAREYIVEASSLSKEIDVSTLLGGIYNISITSDGYRSTKKIAVIK